jgi:hypothetical protein
MSSTFNFTSRLNSPVFFISSSRFFALPASSNAGEAAAFESTMVEGQAAMAEQGDRDTPTGQVGNVVPTETTDDVSGDPTTNATPVDDTSATQGEVGLQTVVGASDAGGIDGNGADSDENPIMAATAHASPASLTGGSRRSLGPSYGIASVASTIESTLKEDVDDGDTTANVGSNPSTLPSYGRTGNALGALDSLGEGNYAVENKKYACKHEIIQIAVSQKASHMQCLPSFPESRRS